MQWIYSGGMLKSLRIMEDIFTAFRNLPNITMLFDYKPWAYIVPDHEGCKLGYIKILRFFFGCGPTGYSGTQFKVG